VGKKKSAQASLEKLSRGLTRETPATRVQETPEQSGRSLNAVEGGGEVTQEATSTTASQERSRRRTGRPRTKPDRMVRVSVDLPRPDHKFLRDFAYDAESDGMSVMRALLEEMRGDEELAERVLNRLAGE
jgi:hypothetical protein